MPSAATGAVVSILNDETAGARDDRCVVTQSPSPKVQPKAAASHVSDLDRSKRSTAASNEDSSETLLSQSRDSSGQTSRTSSEAATSLTSVRPEFDSFNELAYQSKAYQAKILDHSRYAESPTSQPSQIDSSNDTTDDDADVMSIASAGSNVADSTEKSAPFARGRVRAESTVAGSAGSSSLMARGPVVQGGKKRYPCNHPGCDKTFSTSGHAARHNRIHTGQKPYKCTFPGCEASFSRQDNALAHFRSGHALTKNKFGVESDEHDVVMGGGQYDAQVEAGAELGRRALEEGTAIAVIRDGKVERTVGLPRARKSSQSQVDRSRDFDADSIAQSSILGRRPSLTDQSSPSRGPVRSAPTPAAEYAQNHRGVSGPAARFLANIAHTEVKPSSSSSDANPLNVSRRSHPYAIPTSRHKASASSPWDFTCYASDLHPASDGAGSAFTAVRTASSSSASIADSYAPASTRSYSQAWPVYAPASAGQAYANARNQRRDAPTAGGFVANAARSNYPPSDFSHPLPTPAASVYSSQLSPTWQALHLEGLGSYTRFRKPSLPTPDGNDLLWSTGSAGSSYRGSLSNPQSLFTGSSIKPVLPCSSDRSTTLQADSRKRTVGSRDDCASSASGSLTSATSRGRAFALTADDSRIVLPPLRLPNV